MIITLKQEQVTRTLNKKVESVEVSRHKSGLAKIKHITQFSNIFLLILALNLKQKKLQKIFKVIFTFFNVKSSIFAEGIDEQDTIANGKDEITQG